MTIVLDMDSSVSKLTVRKFCLQPFLPLSRCEVVGLGLENAKSMNCVWSGRLVGFMAAFGGLVGEWTAGCCVAL